MEIKLKKESNDFVKEVANQKYEYGFTTDVDTEVIPKGSQRGCRKAHIQEERRARVAARLPPEGLPLLEDPARSNVGTRPRAAYRLPGYILLCRPVGEEAKEQGDRSGAGEDIRQARYPFGGASRSERYRCGCCHGLCLCEDNVQEAVSRERHHLLSIGEAVKEHPDLVKQYLGSVVPYRDNFSAALNSAVFSDGTFVYIPKGVRCPMELSSYFRINARNTGQFERTLIIADDDAYVSYLEGCTAPMRDENQLHAAVVEIVVMNNAEVKYSTVQNWYPGDEHGKGGVLNLVTKRGECRGVNSKLQWTQVETGSAITWKYPSCVLRGDNSQAEFYSVAVTNNYQEADTGTKMIHIGKNTKSTIISKGISAGHSQNSYRGLVRATANADNARNYSSCDSLLLGSDCGAHTFPYMDIHNDTAVVEHEATTSKISVRTSSSIAISVAFPLRRLSDSSSTAMPRRCSTSCLWSLP
jgi:Fe-S cluster assembly protein SufB